MAIEWGRDEDKNYNLSCAFQEGADRRSDPIAPITRSPSQCPGTTFSATSSGLLSIVTSAVTWLPGWWCARARGIRENRPVRKLEKSHGLVRHGLVRRGIEHMEVGKWPRGRFAWTHRQESRCEAAGDPLWAPHCRPSPFLAARLK